MLFKSRLYFTDASPQCAWVRGAVEFNALYRLAACETVSEYPNVQIFVDILLPMTCIFPATDCVFSDRVFPTSELFQERVVFH
jgi:hypothetical protein